MVMAMTKGNILSTERRKDEVLMGNELIKYKCIKSRTLQGM